MHQTFLTNPKPIRGFNVIDTAVWVEIRTRDFRLVSGGTGDSYQRKGSVEIQRKIWDAHRQDIAKENQWRGGLTHLTVVCA